jgi:hypothetical protein
MKVDLVKGHKWWYNKIMQALTLRKNTVAGFMTNSRC